MKFKLRIFQCASERPQEQSSRLLGSMQVQKKKSFYPCEGHAFSHFIDDRERSKILPNPPEGESGLSLGKIGNNFYRDVDIGKNSMIHELNVILCPLKLWGHRPLSRRRTVVSGAHFQKTFRPSKLR